MNQQAVENDWVERLLADTPTAALLFEMQRIVRWRSTAVSPCASEKRSRDALSPD